MASSSTTFSRASGHAARSPESYESLARRNAAAEILQSYEKLSWHSFQRCESLVQTRLHFQNVLAGLTDQDEAALIDWKEDKTPRPKPGEEVRGSSRKGKERLSGGVGVGSTAPKANKTREQSDSSTSGSAKKKRKSLQ